MKTKLITLAVVALMSSVAAQAADVKLYGRVDTGLKFTHVSDQSNSFEMIGGRSHNRIGFNIVEDLGNGYKVKGYLENGFMADTGALDDASLLFNRRSILAVSGDFGEIGAGRAGTVQSTMAPYSMGIIKFDPFGTSYGLASVGTTFANSSRVNNGLHYISPKFNGVHFGLSYSVGDKDDSEASYQNRNHTFAAATNYTGENLFVTLSFADVRSAKNATLPLKEAKTVDLGGWYRLTPEMRVFAGAGYQSNWASAAKMTAKLINKYTPKNTDTGTPESNSLTAQERAEGFDGVSALVGMDYKTGAHKFMAGMQYFDGELSANSSIDFQRTVAAVAYEYYFAKNVIGYAAATTAWSNGSARDLAKANNAKDFKLDSSELFVGLNINF